jgi:succinate-acetate transporter protein
MINKVANPGPLGLIGFGFTTWMLSMINAGWFNAHSMGMVIALAMAYGGTAQMVAGLLEYPRGNTFGTVAFFSYGAFWWSFALFAHYFGAQVPAAFVGWYLFMWGVFTFYMWVATLRINRALQLVFLFLWLTFFVLAIGTWTGASSITVAGGYLGLITALLAFYASAADVINPAFGRDVLPLHAYAAAVSKTPTQQTAD